MQHPPAEYAECVDLLQSHVRLSIRSAAQILEQHTRIEELQSQLAAERTRHANLQRDITTAHDGVRESNSLMAKLLIRGTELWHAKTELEHALHERDQEIARLRAESQPGSKRRKVKAETGL
jgi:chromosome segregation ATPase